MNNASAVLKKVFSELDKRINELNQQRRVEGLAGLSQAQVQLLGQMSLLVNAKVSAILALAQTADLDAVIKTEFLVKEELKKILKQEGLIYDEDSALIWIPPGSRFKEVFRFKNVIVFSIDAESALVSKAIKAPEKNKQLVRQAIASGIFPNLVDRILANDGDLEFFA